MYDVSIAPLQVSFVWSIVSLSPGTIANLTPDLKGVSDPDQCGSIGWSDVL